MLSIWKVVLYRAIWLWVLVALFLIIRGVVVWWDALEEVAQELTPPIQQQQPQPQRNQVSQPTQGVQPQQPRSVDVQPVQPPPWSFDEQVNSYARINNSQRWQVQTRSNAYSSPVANVFWYDPVTLLYDNLCGFSSTFCYPPLLQ